jgi:ABC-2 type transport system permease protein
LQFISYLFPLRYYLVIIRSLMLKGIDVYPLRDEIIALVIFGIGIMSIAALRFRKRLD